MTWWYPRPAALRRLATGRVLVSRLSIFGLRLFSNFQCSVRCVHVNEPLCVHQVRSVQTGVLLLLAIIRAGRVGRAGPLGAQERAGRYACTPTLTSARPGRGWWYAPSSRRRDTFVS